MYYTCNTKEEGAMGISIRVTEEEQKLFRAYADLHGVTVSQLLKETLLERIEDELDIIAADKAYAEYKKNPKTYTLDEILQELEI